MSLKSSIVFSQMGLQHFIPPPNCFFGSMKSDVTTAHPSDSEQFPQQEAKGTTTSLVSLCWRGFHFSDYRVSDYVFCLQLPSDLAGPAPSPHWNSSTPTGISRIEHIISPRIPVVAHLFSTVLASFVKANRKLITSPTDHD